MTYETAKELSKKANEIAFSLIEDVIRDLLDEEFLKIPVIDDHTRIVAQKYAWCFTRSKRGDYQTYWEMYIISNCIMREEKPKTLKEK